MTSTSGQAVRNRMQYGNRIPGKVDEFISIAAIYGYFAGGYTDTNQVTTDQVTFATQATAAKTTANLSQARFGLAGLSDGAI